MRWLLMSILLWGCGEGAGSSAGLADATGIDADATEVFDAGPVDAAFQFDDAAVDAGPPGIHRVEVLVNEIPAVMMGGGAFSWAVPPTGWTLEVNVPHGVDFVPSEPPYLLWRGVSVVQDPEPVPLDELSPPGGLWTETREGHRWQGRVISALPGDVGLYSLEAVVDGVPSVAQTLEIAALTPARDPFVTVDPWLITFERDLETLEVSYDEGFVVHAAFESNGVGDFEEAMAAIGFMGGDAAWRLAMLENLKVRVRTHLHSFFLLAPDTGAISEESVPIRLRFLGDADAPATAEAVAAGWSVMAVGGSQRSGAATVFGRAALDWNNQAVDDNSGPDRGIFTSNLAAFILSHPLTSVLVVDYAPASGGVPFGAVAGDLPFLDLDFDPEVLPDGEVKVRGRRFTLLAENLALALASVIAHEMGHSLGLVKPGLPPEGLLAGVDGAWLDGASAGTHIDTPGFNLMQSGSSFDFADAARGAPRFNAANLAYLRQRLVVFESP